MIFKNKNLEFSEQKEGELLGVLDEILQNGDVVILVKTEKDGLKTSFCKLFEGSTFKRNEKLIDSACRATKRSMRNFFLCEPLVQKLKNQSKIKNNFKREFNKICTIEDFNEAYTLSKKIEEKINRILEKNYV